MITRSRGQWREEAMCFEFTLLVAGKKEEAEALASIGGWVEVITGLRLDGTLASLKCIISHAFTTLSPNLRTASAPLHSFLLCEGCC